MLIRDAKEPDCADIADIYNHAVLNTTAIWNDSVVDAPNRIAWMQQRQNAGYPVIVAELNGRVVGYAAFGDWRAFEGYRYTVEHSVYVHPEHHGKGIGKTLMARLIEIARSLGKHAMVAGIESENAASLHLHRQLGFIETARMPEVGAKFGRWLDLTFMLLRLDDRENPEPAK